MKEHLFPDDLAGDVHVFPVVDDVEIARHEPSIFCFCGPLLDTHSALRNTRSFVHKTTEQLCQ